MSVTTVQADDFVGWTGQHAYQDWARLGRRLFVVDGINPNAVVGERMSDDGRPMGVYPQRGRHDHDYVDLRIRETGTGTAFASGAYYTWGMCWRVETHEGVVLRSAMTLATHTMTATCDVRVRWDAYAYGQPTDATWTVYAELWRSKQGAPQLLYRVMESENAGERNYLDNTPDASLDESYTYDVSVSDPNSYVPPVRCIRAWRGRLVCGGTRRFENGGVWTGSSSAEHLRLLQNAEVRQTDRDAFVWVPELEKTFVILDVAAASGDRAPRWYVDKAVGAVIAEANAATFMMYRDDAVYVTGALPDNIEGYAPEDMVIYDYGSANPLRGIAVAGGFCYLLHRYSIYVLEGTSGAFGAIPLVNGLGCASHATIADRYTNTVYCYAGESGVIAIRGNTVERISAAIDDIIKDEVDHSYDQYTHGVYDLEREMYHLWLFENDSVADLGTAIPTLLLSYDERNGQWYRARCPAVLSGHQTIDWRLQVHVALPGHLGRFDEDRDYDWYLYAGTFVADDTLEADGFTIADDPGFPENEVGSEEGSEDEGTPLSGAILYILDAAGEVLDYQIIETNTTDSVTCYGEFGVDLAVGMQWRIGAMEWYVDIEDVNLRPMIQRKMAQRLAVLVEPDTAENVAKIALRGQFDEAGNENAEYQDMNGSEQLALEGANAGLRSRGFRVLLSGVSGRAVCIRGITLYTQEVNRGK